MQCSVKMKKGFDLEPARRMPRLQRPAVCLDQGVANEAERGRMAQPDSLAPAGSASGGLLQ
jgi:hypothetical protein